MRLTLAVHVSKDACVTVQIQLFQSSESVGKGMQAFFRHKRMLSITRNSDLLTQNFEKIN